MTAAIDSLKRVAYPKCAKTCWWAGDFGMAECRQVCFWKFRNGVPLTAGELRKAWGKAKPDRPEGGQP